MSTWKRINHEGQQLCDVGVLVDGTLYNPRGYPEDLVRAAVAAAEGRRNARRSEAAHKAAETRKRRKEKRVYEVADRIINGHVYGPSRSCVLCGKSVFEPQSIERGIGSDCWQGVMAAIERRRAQLPQPVAEQGDGLPFKGRCPDCAELLGDYHADTRCGA